MSEVLIAESELRSVTEFVPIDTDIGFNDEVEETVTDSEEFSCPVCYTDGTETGLVSPSKCSHKICLGCYTNIAVRASMPVCPMCRTEYLTNSPVETSTPNTSPVITPVRRPLSPNMDSDVMSLLIHNRLPEYSYRNTIADTLIDIERAQIIYDLLSLPL
jgi:hypothetical protein